MLTPAAVARGIVTLQSTVEPPHLSHKVAVCRLEWDVLVYVRAYIGDSTNVFARCKCLRGLVLLLISITFCCTSRDGWL